MKKFTMQDSGRGAISYQDNKRYLWLASVIYPMVALSGIGMYWTTGSEWSFLVPLLFIYGVSTLFDGLFGVDTSNPPEELVGQLEEDTYYRWLTYITIPIHYAVLLILATFVGTQAVSIPAVVALAITGGIYSGLGLVTAHELGHKKSTLERNLAKIVQAVPAYGHFCLEHNRGHHRDVATPEDPASSRMGESIYRFVLREIPGAFRRAWKIEQNRLERRGESRWSWRNEILQSYALTAVLQVGLLVAFGWIMIPFLAVHNFWAWWQLTSANYIEHYGLLRKKEASGRYERCQPHHSWNANHVFSNLLLFHLERHSDHHAHPVRRYQCLRDFPDVPSLPTGYFAMFVAAYIPPLWYSIMDHRLMALPHIGGDLDNVNVAPHRRAVLEARYPKTPSILAEAA
ncbi:MAG: alkane 1-monooxygenase [Halieaceae bacterium]|jgi:alkane 1-monooxygenase|nr:alkane 1-monooxygenase [Halieaceae bacterium]